MTIQKTQEELDREMFGSGLFICFGSAKEHPESWDGLTERGEGVCPGPLPDRDGRKGEAGERVSETSRKPLCVAA